MTLFEDGTTNRLQEEINVFVELWKNEAFHNVIVVFTHGDVLQQQLQVMTIYEIQSFPCMKEFCPKSNVTVKMVAEYIIDKIVESSIFVQ
jgi:F0F1-type ATP synthase gamma subunit